MSRKLLPVLAIALLIGSQPTRAHHSETAEYDTSKPVKVTGTLKKVEWQNPHVWFYVDVKDEQGKVANWTWEGYPPNVLSRTGLKRDVTLKIGDTVTCFGYRARDGSNLAHLREVTAADGKKYFFGPPPGTGEGGAVAN